MNVLGFDRFRPRTCIRAHVDTPTTSWLTSRPMSRVPFILVTTVAHPLVREIFESQNSTEIKGSDCLLVGSTLFLGL